MVGKRALVTGGSGYLGSHVAKKLVEEGYQVDILDIEEPQHNYYTAFYRVDIRQDLETIFKINEFDVVYHFAGRIEVGLSKSEPTEFWDVNVGGTVNLLNTMSKYSVKNIVFASTAAVYLASNSPLRENSALASNSVYGKTKIACEEAIIDSNLNYIILRFFNLSGADDSGLIGENHFPETHLIPNLLRQETSLVYGNDYNTPDGTCIRDYVHVNDVSDACIRAHKHLKDGEISDIINLGSGKGNSVFEVINEIGVALGKELSYDIRERREGDPSFLVADISYAKARLDWKPTYSLTDIIKTAIKYENRLTKI